VCAQRILGSSELVEEQVPGTTSDTSPLLVLYIEAGGTVVTVLLVTWSHVNTSEKKRSKI
jgi:hypothetical protein